MNSVIAIGRLTKDPDVRVGASSQKTVAKFSIALDRGKDKDGQTLGADFPLVTVFGKTAEACERYLKKGRLVGIQGRIHTGSYEGKDGSKVYTTEIYADKVEFLEWGDKHENKGEYTEEQRSIPSGFSQLTDDEIPF